MSLIGSLLGFVLFPLKAQRPKEVENLAVMALAAEVKHLTFALDHWRSAGRALMKENERLIDERDALRRELHSRGDEWRKAYAQAALDFSRERVLAPNAQTQQNVRQRQLSPQELQNYQALQNYAGCTCVPSRSEMFER